MLVQGDEYGFDKFWQNKTKGYGKIQKKEQKYGWLAYIPKYKKDWLIGL